MQKIAVAITQNVLCWCILKETMNWRRYPNPKLERTKLGHGHCAEIADWT
jgi:hypothetical protein